MADRISTEEKRRWLEIAPWFILSVLIHAGFIYYFLPQIINLSEKKDDDNEVKVSLISQKQAHAKPLPQKKSVTKKKKKNPVTPHRQVVDIARPKVEKEPENARFSSKYDSSVKKESRSAFDKNITARGKKLNRQGEHAPRKQLAVVVKKQREISPNKKTLPGVTKMERKQQKVGYQGKRGEMARGKKIDKEIKGAEKGVKKEVKEQLAVVGGHKIPQRFLLSSSGSTNPMTSPSNDYLKDIALGDETALNTKKFLYADYYNRIKQAVSYYWSPAQTMLVNDPRGSIYGKQNRSTRLKAVIGKRGKLLSLVVARSSGVDILDREALDAFSSAAPFPNPPKPLMNEKGEFVFYLGFYVQMH